MSDQRKTAPETGAVVELSGTGATEGTADKPEPQQTLLEVVAMSLYEAEGMTLLIGTTEESWRADRESVRARYRAKARENIRAALGGMVGSHGQ